METSPERRAGLKFKFQVSKFKEEGDLISAIKDWLPITKRNRVALGFALAALVIFVVWNLMPIYDFNATSSERRVFQVIWMHSFDFEYFRSVIASLNMDVLRVIFIRLAFMLNGLLVFTILPFWKIVHASGYLTVPLAVASAAGGLYFFSWGFYIVSYSPASVPHHGLTLFLVSKSMLLSSAALLIFKNELALRHELEVKKMMDS